MTMGNTELTKLSVQLRRCFIVTFQEQLFIQLLGVQMSIQEDRHILKILMNRIKIWLLCGTVFMRNNLKYVYSIAIIFLLGLDGYHRKPKLLLKEVFSKFNLIKLVSNNEIQRRLV